MAQNTTNTVEVEHNSETIEVPTTFERSDLATWFGSIPDEWDVERVFVYEGNVRAEAYLGDETWIEAIYQTEESAPVFNASELGWVVDTIDAPAETEYDRPGETLWERDA